MPMLMVFCQKRRLRPIVDKLGDWHREGAQVLLHGVSNKAHDGFVLLRWNRPIPEQFISKLVRDPDILDYLPYDLPTQESSTTPDI